MGCHFCGNCSNLRDTDLEIRGLCQITNNTGKRRLLEMFIHTCITAQVTQSGGQQWTALNNGF